MADATPDSTQNPDAIWLSPACDGYAGDRTWAAPAPEDACEECHQPWVRYIREDLATPSPDSGERMCGAKPDHADIMETIQNAADDWQKNGYTSALAEVRDMANVGRSLMEALPKGYCYMDSPAEIVSDLQNELDELRQSLTAREPATADVGREVRARLALTSEISDHVAAAKVGAGVDRLISTKAAIRAMIAFADDEAALSRAAPSSEPFGYWVEQRHAEPALLRKPAYIPEASDLRTVTPLYATPAASGEIPGGMVPIPMILHCPRCHVQHIDEPDERTPEWDNPPHRSHLCHACGCIWRPADVPTEGVAQITTVGKADTPITAPKASAETGEVDYLTRAADRMKAIAAIPEGMIDAALNATVPGGAQVSAWLPQKDAWTPHETARDVIRYALHAALSAAPSAPTTEAGEEA